MKRRHQGQRAVVLGLGMTGLSLVAAPRAPRRLRARRRYARRSAESRGAGGGTFRTCRSSRGPFSDATFDGVDLIAISPGVAQRDPAIRAAVEAGAAARRRHRALRARIAGRPEGACHHRHQRQDDGRIAHRRADACRRTVHDRRRQHRSRQSSMPSRCTRRVQRGRACSCSSCRAISSKRRRAWSRLPQQCSTYRRTTWTATRESPITPRRRRGSSSRRRVQILESRRSDRAPDATARAHRADIRRGRPAIGRGVGTGRAPGWRRGSRAAAS